MLDLQEQFQHSRHRTQLKIILLMCMHKTQLPFNKSSTSDGLWEFLCCRSNAVVSILVGYGASSFRDCCSTFRDIVAVSP